MRVKPHNNYDREFGDTIVLETSSIGSHELLEIEEYEQIKNAIIALQEQVHCLKKSLRAVCIDTENPIHF